MPKICYVNKDFQRATLSIIDVANKIIDEYSAQGFDLTLRQLYYQFVARDILPNTQKSYNKLGSILNDARLSGLVDWDCIEDRTRFVRELAHWNSPADIVEACSNQFRIDRWADQEYRPEVWIEKDALVGVIEGVCKDYDVPFFSCRGYVSQSEMWGASQRLIKHLEKDQTPYIIHLGDHDPSGVDMTRDIFDRLKLFIEHEGYEECEVNRIALTIEQVKKYKPPPNPAKITDSRATGYIRMHGQQSWELDALDPKTLAGLIRETIIGLIDGSAWKASDKRQWTGRKLLKDTVKYLNQKSP